jgi:transcriptional regulator with XRE-family HTH domain
VASFHPDLYGVTVRLLVRARKEAGLTQDQLAQRIGQRQTFVSKLELGERRLDVAEFMQVSRAIGADPYKLLREAESAR